MGASGSGKSTLMNILGCLDKPDQRHLPGGGNRYRAVEWRCAGSAAAGTLWFYLSTLPLCCHILPPRRTLEVPAVYAGSERRARLARAHDLLVRLGLGDRADYQPSQLSGGQQQRVSIARALMNGGEVILADEPTGALDSHSGEEVMAILHQLKAQGHTVIIVTHDPQVAAQAERIIEIPRWRDRPQSARQPPGRWAARPSAAGTLGVASVYQWLSRSAGYGVAGDGGE